MEKQKGKCTLFAKENSRKLVAIIAIVMIIAGMMLANFTLSGYGTIERKNLYLEGNMGQIHAEIFVPKDASAENKKPAILLATGGTGNLEVLENICLELARRGYVTMTYDPYQVSRSETAVDKPSDGGTVAYQHLISLDYVDANNTGLMGHSAGGGRIIGVYNSGINTEGIKAIMGLGAATQASPEMDVDVGVCIGSFDLTSLPKSDPNANAGTGTNGAEYLNAKSSLNALIGQDPKATYEFNTWYDTVSGNKFIFYSDFFGHTLAFMLPTPIKCVVDFFTTTIPTDTTVSGDSIIYPMKSLSALVALVGFIMLIFPIGSWLLDRKFFSSLKGEVPEPAGTANLPFWFFFVLPAILSALIANWAIFEGQTWIDANITFMRAGRTNGFITWFACNALITLGILILRFKFDKNVDQTRMITHLKTGAEGIGKALLLGAAVFGCLYAVTMLCTQQFGGEPRFWRIHHVAMSNERIGQMLIYLVPYLIFNCVAGYAQTLGFRIKKWQKWTFTFLIFAASMLGSVLYLGDLYIGVFTTGISPVNSAAKSRAVNALFTNVYCYLYTSKIQTYFYEKTGSFYVGSIINGIMLCWLSICMELLTFVG